MKILFICTHNRCRSILAEAITNHLAQEADVNDRVIARSAGSQPVGAVHPLTLKHLQNAQISISDLESQSWDDHEAWNPDVVITVCDSAAGETCPVWFGNAVIVHWGLNDPSKVSGTPDKITEAFQKTIELISHRISRLLVLSETDLSPERLEQSLLALANSN